MGNENDTTPGALRWAFVILSSLARSRQTQRPAHLRWGNRLLEGAETLMYPGIALFLVVTAISCC